MQKQQATPKNPQKRNPFRKAMKGITSPRKLKALRKASAKRKVDWKSK